MVTIISKNPSVFSLIIRLSNASMCIPNMTEKHPICNCHVSTSMTLQNIKMVYNKYTYIIKV